MIKAMLGQLGGVLGNTFLNFVNTIIQGAGKLADSIKEVAPKIAEAVVVVIDTILFAIWAWIPGAVESFMQMLDLVFDALIEYMPSLLVKLGEMVTIVLDWINENIEGWTESLVEIILGLLVGAITGLTNKIDDIVSALFDFFIALNESLAENMRTKGDDLLDSIGGVIVEFFTLIGKAAKKYWSFMEDFGGDIIEKIVDGLSDALVDVTDWFKKLFTEKIPNALSEVWTDLKQLGEDLLNAILEGLEGAWETGKKAIKAFGGEVLDGLKASFGISSPSKETAKMGDYLGQGVAVGLKESTKDTEKEVKKFGEDTLDALNDSLSSDAFDDEYDLDLTGKLHIDTTELDTFNVDDLFKDNSLFGNFASSFDASAMLAGATAQNEADREAQEQRNNDMYSLLTENIAGLKDKLGDSNIITVPDNATFNIPVMIDGETTANATAPFLDIIAGTNLDLESKGVTSR
jgi:hypothetical protein